MATVFVRGAMLYDTGGTTTVVVGNHAAHRVRTVSLGFIGFGGGFTVQPAMMQLTTIPELRPLEDPKSGRPPAAHTRNITRTGDDQWLVLGASYDVGVSENRGPS